MAIAWDATSTLSHTGTTNPDTWSHGGAAGGIKGVIVAAINYTDDVNEVSAVTYGGVSLTKIGEAADAAGETTNVSLWFRGDSLPSGTQTVSVSFITATDDYWLVAYSFTGAGNIAVADWDVTSGDQANPSVTLQNPDGHTVLPVAAFAGGLAATTNYTDNHTTAATTSWQDSGQEVQAALYGATTTGTSVTIGYTSTSDDTALIGAILTDQITNASAGVAQVKTAVTSGALGGPLAQFKPVTGTTQWFGGAVSDDGSQIIHHNLGSSTVYSLNSGDTWTSGSVLGSGSWHQIGYGNGYFVAVGVSGGTLIAKYSTNLTSWTTFAPWGTAPASTYTAVAYGNGWWMIVTDNGSAYINGNPNGTWTTFDPFSGGVTAAYGLFYFGGTWLLAQHTGSPYYRTGTPTTGWATTNNQTSIYWFDYDGTYWVGSAATGTTYYTTAVGAGAWTTCATPTGWESGTIQNSGRAPLWSQVEGLWHISTGLTGNTQYQTMSASAPNAAANGWTRTVDKWGAGSTYPYRSFHNPSGSYAAINFDAGYLVSGKNPMPLSKTVGAAAGVASATGTAQQPTISAVGGGSDTNVNAGEITDTALAQGVTGKVDASAGAATAAAAGQGATGKVDAPVGVATAAGAGQAATGKVSPTAGLPAPAGVALTGTTHIQSSSNSATAAGAGLTTTSKVDATSASNSATGVAYDATTTSQAGDANAQAGAATATATAEQVGGGDRVSYAGFADVRGVRAA